MHEKIGICLDTCHIFTAGYDLVNKPDSVLKTFDSVIGFEYLKALHLNDRVFPPGSHKDRHANMGEGKIGIAGITQIINHPKLRNLPFNLETHHERHAIKLKLRCCAVCISLIKPKSSSLQNRIDNVFSFRYS